MQPNPAWLDKLLWKILQVRTLPGICTPKSPLGEVGYEEIQKAQGAPEKRHLLDRKGS